MQQADVSIRSHSFVRACVLCRNVSASQIARGYAHNLKDTNYIKHCAARREFQLVDLHMTLDYHCHRLPCAWRVSLAEIIGWAGR